MACHIPSIQCSWRHNPSKLWPHSNIKGPLGSTKVYLGSDEPGNATNRATRSLIVWWQVSGLMRSEGPWNAQQTFPVLTWVLLLPILLFHPFICLDTQISTQRSVSSGWGKWTLSEMQTTLMMAVMQWWITLMFLHALNPLKGGIEFHLVSAFIPFLNWFLNYWNEELQTRHILAIHPSLSPSMPQFHFLPFKELSNNMFKMASHS